MNRHPHFEAPREPEEEMIALDAGHFFADDFGTTAAEQAAHEPLDARLSRERPDVDSSEPARVLHPLRIPMDDPGHWNVIATTRPNREADARATMAKLGNVALSPFPGVILAAVDDVGVFNDALAKMISDDAGAGQSFGRVLPAQHTFHFESLADLEGITASIVDDWIEDLADATFHVRCHRRGRVNDLDPAEEEGFLGDAIQRMLSERGTSARISFDDPDVVIDIETLNDEAAISMWTRDDLVAFSFLRID
jgi:tRNA(Ser,Leu) C12 N-acetylase TAN1